MANSNDGLQVRQNGYHVRCGGYMTSVLCQCQGRCQNSSVPVVFSTLELAHSV